MFCVTPNGIRHQQTLLVKAAQEPPAHVAARAARDAKPHWESEDGPRRGGHYDGDGDGGEDQGGETSEEVAEADTAKGVRAGGPGRHPLTGQYQGEIAADRPAAPGSPRKLDYQPGRTPEPLATLATVRGTAGPIGSSIAMHQGQAVVSQYAAAQAASPGLAGQLGHLAPSGVPGQVAWHTAPIGHGGEAA